MGYTIEDFERQHLIDRCVIEADENELFIQIMNELEADYLTTKIEIADEQSTRIEVGKEVIPGNKQNEILEHGF